MRESDNRINNIFTNYSSHNYIEILSRMHPMHYFIKKILEKAYIFYITQAGSITIPPHYLKILPHLFEHEFLPPSPPPPPPGNNTIYDHNAMLAFPGIHVQVN